MSNLKQDILKLLENDRFISGQDMADELGVSRTAVWKGIRSLKEAGYVIDSTPNRGYQLKGRPGYFNAALLEALVERSLVFDHIEYLGTTESTQTEAFKRLETDAGSFIVIAEEQTKGRGRFNRRWESPLKTGLYLSLVLRPRIAITEIIRFNLFISLAISKALDESFGIHSGIKWPNDIYIADRKVSGFLTEVVSEGNVINAIICGIGINIFRDGALDGISNATSVEEAMPDREEIDMDAFAERLLHQIEVYYRLFLEHPFSYIRDEWKERAIVLGRELRITEMHGSYKAKALDVSEDGFLEVLDQTGQIRKVISADIEL